MYRSSQINTSTRRSTSRHGRTSDTDSEESSLSEGMIKGLTERSGDFKYRCTNLVANCGQKISGIELFDHDKNSIMAEYESLILEQFPINFQSLILDPKALYEAEKKKGEVETMVPYDEIEQLANKAHRLYQSFLNKKLEEEKKEEESQRSWLLSMTK